jgi:hypothetical protein
LKHSQSRFLVAKATIFVILAQAGIQFFYVLRLLDSRLRGNDGLSQCHSSWWELALQAINIHQRHKIDVLPITGDNMPPFFFEQNSRFSQKLFMNVASDGQARRKTAKKRSVQVVHEHFELFFNTAWPSAAGHK